MTELVDAIALRRANQAWRRTQEAYVAIFDAEDVRDAEDAWEDFLVQFARIYIRLGRAVSNHPSAKAQWHKIMQERESDALLAYLRHARNVDEHHLHVTTAAAGIEARIGFKNMGGGWISSITLNPDGTIELEGSDQNGAKPLYIQRRVLRALPAVSTDGKAYPLPTTHLGKPFTSSDVEAITIAALEYIAKVFRLFQEDPATRPAEA